MPARPVGDRPTGSERSRERLNVATSRRNEFLVPPHPAGFDLASYDTRSKVGLESKALSRRALQRDIEQLAKLQDVFAAQSRYALLIVLQGMDAAGKDGIIKHVMSGINPQGVDVYSFRRPTEEEDRHDFLWRESKVLPARGRIAIFNRSHYEEVLVVRVQPELLGAESAALAPNLWQQRYEEINAFERHLSRNGTIVLKFFLHISMDEQRKRLLARLETPKKMWKISAADLQAHRQWDAYAAAYRDAIANTSTQWAPWYVIPSDRKWVARAVVGAILNETLENLNLSYPEPPPEQLRRYAELADQLKSESSVSP
jgi:PPK2 family polyphosphate:nucleotide phosphotransferase